MDEDRRPAVARDEASRKADNSQDLSSLVIINHHNHILSIMSDPLHMAAQIANNLETLLAQGHITQQTVDETLARLPVQGEAKWEWEAQDVSGLVFPAGSKLLITHREASSYWLATLPDGRTGQIPDDYITLLPYSSASSLPAPRSLPPAQSLRPALPPPQRRSVDGTATVTTSASADPFAEVEHPSLKEPLKPLGFTWQETARDKAASLQRRAGELNRSVGEAYADRNVRNAGASTSGSSTPPPPPPTPQGMRTENGTLQATASHVTQAGTKVLSAGLSAGLKAMNKITR